MATLQGAYRGASGAIIDFGDGSGGNYHAKLPNGTQFDEPYTLSGDTLTIASPAGGASPCAGVTGSYTVSQDGDQVTFTAVDDACATRKQNLTTGAWSRVEAGAGA